MGVVYIIVFAALLVKAVDNWRFADMEYSNHQYRCVLGGSNHQYWCALGGGGVTISTGVLWEGGVGEGCVTISTDVRRGW